MWPFKIKKKPSTPAEEQLDIIKNILFPPAEIKQEIDPKNENKPFKWLVDYSADMNLHAALVDLEEGHNDPAVHKTIKDIIERIVKIRDMFEARMEFDPEAEYIMVESKKESEDGYDT